LAAAAPGAGQPFRDEDVAQASTVSDEHAKLATVSVGIAPRPRVKLKRTLVDQGNEPVGGFVPRANSDAHFGSLISGVSISATRIFSPLSQSVSPSTTQVMRLVVPHFWMAVGSSMGLAASTLDG
jgi:hypothetical protein